MRHTQPLRTPLCHNTTHLPSLRLVEGHASMAGCFRTRKARFEWSDYISIRISPSPTKNSKVTAAVKKERQTWAFRQTSSTPPQVYVRKTVSINGDILKGRDVPREYETWSSLGSHPYVLACEDFQCLANAHALDEATFWSEYCEMGDLGQFVTIQGSGHRSLSPFQAEQIAYQILSALAFIHYGLYITLDDHGSVEELELFDHATLMHRDIKPQNSTASSFILHCSLILTKCA
jgi:serine/threonine protein kinase